MDGDWALHVPDPAARVRPRDPGGHRSNRADRRAAPAGSTPAEALGALDQRLTAGTPYLLVAQHAATEANVLHNQAEHSPTLARTDLLDTIPLAKRLIPNLPNYKLDTLLAHFGIPQPTDRHRAPADVDVTAKVFLRLISAADEDPRVASLAALVKTAGRTAKANFPVQAGLFDV